MLAKYRRGKWALGVVGALTLVLATGAQAQPREPIVSDTRVNADASESRWHGMATVAVDRNNREHVVVTERQQQDDSSCWAHTSYDAMATWEHREIPFAFACARYDTAQRLHVAIGGDSRAYFLADGATGIARLVISPDGGLGFEDVVTVDSASGNASRMAVRVMPGRPDEIYVVRNAPSPTNQFVRAAMVSVSLDGGSSFLFRTQASEIDKSAGAGLDNEGPRIAVGPAESVYVLYSQRAPTFVAPPGGPAPTGRLWLSRSADRGRTWTNLPVEAGIPIPSTEMNNYWPNLAVDEAQGTIYALWSDERNLDADLFLRRSTDQGNTWQPVQRLSHDAVRSGRHQYRGSISVAPDGRVDVVYYDVANTCPVPAAPVGVEQTIPCYDTNVYARSSSDGGATFSPAYKLNEVPFDFRLRRRTWSNFDTRDVNSSVASADGLAYAAWLDTRAGTPDNHNRDIVAARIQYDPLLRLKPLTRFVVRPVIERRTRAGAVVSSPGAAAPPPAAPVQPPPPPQPPMPIQPIPPAAPIVPPQPAPLIAGQANPQLLGVLAFAPGAELEAEAVPVPRLQQATGKGDSTGAVLVQAVGVPGSLALIAVCVALLARLPSNPRPSPSRGYMK